MTSIDTGKALEGEVLRLFQLVQKMRQDLATVCHPAGSGQILDTAADQLNAISAESENATDEIMDASEKIMAIAKQMGSEIKYGGARHYFEGMEKQSERIMEACQLHDLISQRIAKIVRTINAVEGTINSLVVTLGDGGITGVSSALAEIDKLDGHLTLSGPALEGEGLEQVEIDDLFDEPGKQAGK